MKPVPDHHANTFKHLSWLSLFSSLYGYSRGHYFYACVPTCVWFTSFMYWSRNDYSLWRYIDIVVVQLCLWFQIYYSQWFNTMIYFNVCMLFSVGFFCIALVSKYNWNKDHFSFICHCLVHIFANIGNVILYTGTNIKT